LTTFEPKTEPVINPGSCNNVSRRRITTHIISSTTPSPSS
jgi:hypothetical protein